MAAGYQTTQASMIGSTIEEKRVWRETRNWVLADNGEQFLRRHFKDKGLEFHTAIEHVRDGDRVKAGIVTLTVYRVSGQQPLAAKHAPISDVELFKVSENVEDFVSEHLFAKIVLVA